MKKSLIRQALLTVPPEDLDEVLSTIEAYRLCVVSSARLEGKPRMRIRQNQILECAEHCERMLVDYIARWMATRDSTSGTSTKPRLGATSIHPEDAVVKRPPGRAPRREDFTVAFLPPYEITTLPGCRKYIITSLRGFEIPQSQWILATTHQAGQVWADAAKRGQH